MATVEVRATAFIAGELPAICAVTGEPTSGRARMIAPTGEGVGSWWLKLVAALFGHLFPLSVSDEGPRGGVIAGWLPVSESAQRRHLWRHRRLRLRLDRSRRWLIIDGVHPAFVQAAISETESGGAASR